LARFHVHPAEVRLPRRLVYAPFAIAVVASALLGAPAAHATVAADVAAVTSEVEAATNALPGPPVPIETPDVPKVPVPSPSVAPPPPSVPGVAEEGVERTAPARTERPAVVPNPDALGEPAAGPVSRKPDRRSIGPAEAAPPLRWRAYVWPAIALRVGDVLKPLLAPMDSLAHLRMPDVFGLFSSSAVHGSVGIDHPKKRSGLLGQDRQSPGLALPENGTGLVAALLIGLLLAVGLVALARLVVGEELFEGRYWRGHRG
jgi:hypothetical protein